jgi:phosphate starvation-inducible protein PhoH
MSRSAQRYTQKVKPQNGQSRQQKGEQDIAQDNMSQSQDFNLSWFKPTPTQQQIVRSIQYNLLTAVQASSGCGKSTTAIWTALKLLKEGQCKNIVFVKSAAEYGDDQIGFLTGDSNQKLQAHFEVMRSIFHDFMSPTKLEYEEKRKRITFTVPNFIAGKTFYDSIIIIDEAQTLSPMTMKMLLERASDTSKFVVLGDKKQTYANRKRIDGFTDFVSKIVDKNGCCLEEDMNVIYMTSDDNMRGKLSKRVLEIYGG